MLIQGAKSGTGLLYDSWMKDLGVQPANAIVVHNLVALIGLTIAGLGVSYLPKKAVGQMLAEGSLALLKVTPALPPVSYVAMYKGEHRSSLLASIILLAQESCDFTRMFQATGDDAGR